jgi:hypothetical protein
VAEAHHQTRDAEVRLEVAGQLSGAALIRKAALVLFPALNAGAIVAGVARVTLGPGEAGLIQAAGQDATVADTV